MTANNNAAALAHKSAYEHNMFDFLAKVETVRDLAQVILTDAVMARTLDEAGEIGCSLLTDFTIRVGDKRAFNITAIRDYIAWVFTPGAIIRDNEGKPIVEADKSAVSWNPGSKDKPAKWSNARAMVEEVNDKGETVTKRRPISVNVQDVRIRLATYKWFDFNPARPEQAYKGKAVKAILADIKAMKNGKWQPGDDMAKFLSEVDKLMDKYGDTIVK